MHDECKIWEQFGIRAPGSLVVARTLEDGSSATISIDRGLLAVDDVVPHAEQSQDLRALVAADDALAETVVSTGAALLFVDKSR